MSLYVVTIFLSAFLLFQAEPIVAKMILPWFGGASAVWNTCMLFFQTTLLLGYLYAHWLHEKLDARKQAIAHTVLLALSLAALPIAPNPAWKDPGAGHPSLRILALLTATLGLPYFLLSSTSPLLQAWYARSNRKGLPYRLFALSNLASLAALLSYPLLVEPHLTSRTQGLAWSAAYVCFAALCALTAWRSAARPAAQSVHPEPESKPPEPTWRERLQWTALAAAASILLLSVTEHLTQDVAAIPFLWIVPLSAYLLSFVVCFEAPRLYYRPVFIPLTALSLAFMAYRLSPGRGFLAIRPAIMLFAVALFACCTACHGELARIKPHPRRLTGFYLAVSLGGALGGLFVGLAAPVLFDAYYEIPIGLGFCAVLVFLSLAREPGFFQFRDGWASAAIVVALGGYLLYVGGIMKGMESGARLAARNFYGELRVKDVGDPSEDADARRELIHGVIIHGQQMLCEEDRRSPVTYFCPETGIGRAMRALEHGPRRIGILGLGCGTLAAYGRPGDALQIYEINPLVVEIAETQFSYLRDTPARVHVEVGDGRMLLEAEPNRRFDLLVMDAFSGDSVPVHLITREAFRTYFRHLRPGGILAVNISNKYLDLRPVMVSAAAAFRKIALAYDFEPRGDDSLCFACSWTLMMSRAALSAHPELLDGAQELEPERGFHAWTDQFSNLLGILK